MTHEDREISPDDAPAADLPKHARERLAEMRKRHFYSSDLSVNEFLLVKQAGFDPLGLVMGSSIYRIQPTIPSGSILGGGPPGGELETMTQALYHSRELAETRMIEEAEALGADGVVGVRLDLNLHAWGKHIAEFVCIGTAVRHREGESFRNFANKPFTSALTGQDFWTLLRAGYRPLGFVMGNCVYYIPPDAINAWTGDSRNVELIQYTHSFYDARELAIERLQAEAEDLHATGIVGVEVEAKEHSWKNFQRARGAAGFGGEILEFFVAGTAVVPLATRLPIPVPTMVIPVNG